MLDPFQTLSHTPPQISRQPAERVYPQTFSVSKLASLFCFKARVQTGPQTVCTPRPFESPVFKGKLKSLIAQAWTFAS